MGRWKEFFEQHKKIVAAVIAGIAVVALAIIVFKVLFSATLYLEVAPQNLTVKVNGKEYTNGRKRMFIGNKTIEISGEGIETETFDVFMGVGKNEMVLRAYVINEDYTDYKTNRDSYAILKHYNQINPEEKNTAFIDKMEKAYFLKNHLPLENSFYNSYNRLAYSTLTDATLEEGCEAIFCMRLSIDTEAAEKGTRENLKNMGYDYDDYVVFKGELGGEDEEN